MEKTYKRVPFDIELAKDIQSGKVEGKIVTNHGKVVTLVDAAYGFNEGYWIPIIWHWSTEHNQLVLYNSKGECRNSHRDCYLHIELPEEAPKQKGELTLGKCKEGDEVWIYSNYEYGPEYVKVKVGKFSLDSGHRRNVTFENGFTFQELICQTCWYENPEEQKTKTKEFKPFDKVLVRNEDTEGWQSRLYDQYLIGLGHGCQDNFIYQQCIPYEGNEHFLGTTKSY